MRPLTSMVRLTFHKAEHETWLGAALRIGRKYDAEDEVSQVFSACIDADMTPEEAACTALFECDLLEFEVDLS